MTPLPDAAHPGYPLFVKGEYLQRAYRAPGAVVADRFAATRPELAPPWRHGPKLPVRGDHGPRARQHGHPTGPQRATCGPRAFFIDPCPTGAPVRQYHPTAVDAKIVYNKAGWHDPDGKMYVEAPATDPGSEHLHRGGGPNPGADQQRVASNRSPTTCVRGSGSA